MLSQNFGTNGAVARSSEQAEELAQAWWTYSPRKVDEEWLEGAHGCAYKREEISKEEAYMAVGPRDASHGTIPYIRNQPVWARKFSREALDRHYDAIAAKKGCTPGVFCPGGFFKY